MSYKQTFVRFFLTVQILRCVLTSLFGSTLKLINNDDMNERRRIVLCGFVNKTLKCICIKCSTVHVSLYHTKSAINNHLKKTLLILVQLFSTFNSILLVTTNTSCLLLFFRRKTKMFLRQKMNSVLIVQFIVGLGKCRWRFDLAIFQSMHLDRYYGKPSQSSSMVRSPFHAIFDIYRSR